MGGSSKGGVPNSQIQAGELQNQNALTAIAQQSSQQGNQLFNASFPGFQTAENASSILASGDPAAISRLIAPATQQINSATAGSIQNIMQNAPAGGEKNLALEQANVAQGAQVGALASQGYTNSFNSLAQLAGHGIGLGQGATGAGLSAYGQANQGYSNMFNQNMQQKGAALGAAGGLLGDAATVGGAMFGAAGNAGGFSGLFA